MKRFAAVFLCLITAVSLLSGCQKETAVSCKDLSITLPGEFIDLSEEPFAQDADFLFGKDTLIVMGIAEEKALVDVSSLEDYTTLVLSSNQLSCIPERCTGGYLFTYEAFAGELSYSYTTVTYQTGNYYWILQCYCPSALLPVHQTDIDRIFRTILPDLPDKN